MAKKNNYQGKFIPLKEAARISGYSSDYIGYLIREGKIMGRPVYTNISWQTTAEEVLNYKNRDSKKNTESGKKVVTSFRHFQKRAFREIKIIKLFFATFREVLPIILVLILSFSILIGFSLYMGLNKRNAGNLKSQESLERANEENNLQY
jgi:hypothetical protein